MPNFHWPMVICAKYQCYSLHVILMSSAESHVASFRHSNIDPNTPDASSLNCQPAILLRSPSKYSNVELGDIARADSVYPFGCPTKVDCSEHYKCRGEHEAC
jgi:hypothetical protein